MCWRRGHGNARPRPSKRAPGPCLLQLCQRSRLVCEVELPRSGASLLLRLKWDLCVPSGHRPAPALLLLSAFWSPSAGETLQRKCERLHPHRTASLSLPVKPVCFPTLHLWTKEAPSERVCNFRSHSWRWRRWWRGSAARWGGFSRLSLETWR